MPLNSGGYSWPQAWNSPPVGRSENPLIQRYNELLATPSIRDSLLNSATYPSYEYRTWLFYCAPYRFFFGQVVTFKAQ